MKVIIGDSWRTVEFGKAFKTYSPLKDKNLTIMEPKVLKDMPAVRLSISEEGKESLRARAQELGGCWEPQDFTPAIISMDYSHIFRQKLTAWDYSPNHHTIEEKATDLVQAYGKLYDEIVRGHESGQREIYVEAPGSKEQARKITLSEELACLDEAFQKYTDELNQEIERIPQFRAFQEKRMDFLLRAAKWSAKMQRLDEEKATEELLAQKLEYERQISSELIPENVGEKMAAAVRDFIKQYLGDSMRNVSEILANIKVF